jgi:hypothetical protein
VADGLLPLQQMAQRGPLAADSGGAPVPTMTPLTCVLKQKCRCRIRTCLGEECRAGIASRCRIRYNSACSYAASSGPSLNP